MLLAPGNVLRVGIALIVNAMASIGVTVPEKLHFFTSTPEKSAKIENRQSPLID
jgi:uncharacterized protein YaiE (UPF0345 family)